MAPSGQSTTIAHPSPTWEEQLAFIRGTTFCVPHPDRGQKAQQKQRCSSSKPVNTVQVGPQWSGTSGENRSLTATPSPRRSTAHHASRDKGRCWCCHCRTE